MHTQRRSSIAPSAAFRKSVDAKFGNAVELQDGDLVFVDASEDMVGVGKSVEIANLNRQPVVAGLHTIACRGGTDCWAPGFKAYLQFIPAFKQSLERVAKEANETLYWLELLHESNYLTSDQFTSIYPDAEELVRLLVTIVKTSRENT